MEEILNSAENTVHPFPGEYKIKLPELKCELMLFLGAGASIPAGVPGVDKMVDRLLETLSNEPEYLELFQDIVDLLQKWVDAKKNKLDIELLLEAIEKIENKDDDVSSIFYDNAKNVIQKIYTLWLNSNKKVLLSDIVKRFIKAETGKFNVHVLYLNGLLDGGLMENFRPLTIFSTNYDVCIERFCALNNKKYFDGFAEEWDPEKFNDPKKDIFLYKLHGSVTWSRSEKGKYTRNEIAIKDAEESQMNIVTGEREIPLILYPGKKLEYNEPVFDVFIALKRHLINMRYVFVVGYTFRDDHIRRLFQYTARKNPQLTLFLISPSAHEIYYSELKIYKDKDFPHEMNLDNKTRIDSDLKGRVICLPYKFENVLSQLYHTYLKSLEAGQRCEESKRLEERSNREIGKLTRWDDCLAHYLECEHIEKMKQIIDQKIGWDLLMKINYELGGKIIVKSFMSFLYHDKERQEWFQKYVEHLPVSPQKIEVDINESEGLFLKFKQPSEFPLGSYNLYPFYKSLLEIYDKHLVFSNGDVSKTENNHGLSLNQIVEYLGLWKENIPLINYPERRKGKYGEEIKLEQKIDEYYENKSGDLKKDIIKSITDIEVQELGKLIVNSPPDLH